MTQGSSAKAWETRYAGYWFEILTGLHHVRHRFLASGIGRWLTRDPIDYGMDQLTLNTLCYSLNSPLTNVDPHGLFIVKSGGHRDASDGKGMPAGAGTGRRFVLTPEATEGPQFIQDVTVTGTLICETTSGYNVLGFRYTFTEAWNFTRGGVSDSHINSPNDAASMIDNKCACKCDWTKSRSFTATAKFVAHSATIVPKPAGFALTAVVASTVIRCADSGEEGMTLNGNDAIMSMYPGKDYADPAGAKTPLMRATIVRVPASLKTDTDTWNCAGNGNAWACRYNTNEYAG